MPLRVLNATAPVAQQQSCIITTLMMNIATTCRTRYEHRLSHRRNPVFKRLAHRNILLFLKNIYNIYRINPRGENPEREKQYYIKRNKVFFLCSYVRPLNKRLSAHFDPVLPCSSPMCKREKGAALRLREFFGTLKTILNDL